MTDLMPAVFIGHGNPMNALKQNTFTDGWAAIGKAMPQPKAILAISAHWYVPGTFVTAQQTPQTIHDFGGFAPELHQFEYPAPGSPALAWRVKELLAPTLVDLDQSWGLDHGTWSVLCHVFPKADIPVVQLSLDANLPPQSHYDLAKRLAPLREEGVLIVGSGNIVHNLRTYVWAKQDVEPFDWAVRFEKLARKFLLKGDDAPLINYTQLSDDALLSVPTPEHYLPLLYVLALRRQDEQASFPVEGNEGGSISMLSVRIG